jgi:hypothetical protein
VVTYLVEPWLSYFHDAERPRLWQEHYDYLRLAHEGRLEMSPDIASYAEFDRLGQLSIMVARERGRMIGYCLMIIKPHLHYSKSLCAFEDAYFVTEEARKGLGRTGYELIRRSLVYAKHRGAKRAFFLTKEFASVARLLVHLGGAKSDEVFAFWLDDLELGA